MARLGRHDAEIARCFTSRKEIADVEAPTVGEVDRLGAGADASPGEPDLFVTNTRR
jgi:hypothetical protein